MASRGRLRWKGRDSGAPTVWDPAGGTVAAVKDWAQRCRMDPEPEFPARRVGRDVARLPHWARPCFRPDGRRAGPGFSPLKKAAERRRTASWLRARPDLCQRPFQRLVQERREQRALWRARQTGPRATTADGALTGWRTAAALPARAEAQEETTQGGDQGAEVERA
jgi:hypothetical protein